MHGALGKVMTDEREIYTRQGFAQRTGLGSAPAVIVVDFVLGFTDPAHFGGGNINAAIGQTTHLLALARGKGWPIVHTRVVYADDGSDCGVLLIVRDNQFDFYFGQKVHRIFTATVDFRMAFLAAETFDLAHGHAFDADLTEGILHFFEFEWFYNRVYFLHIFVV